MPYGSTFCFLVFRFCRPSSAAFFFWGGGLAGPARCKSVRLRSSTNGRKLARHATCSYERKVSALFPSLLLLLLLPIMAIAGTDVSNDHNAGEATCTTNTRFFVCRCLCPCVCVARPMLPESYTTLGSLNNLHGLDGSRGERFAEMSETSREQIARLGHSFVRDGTVVLTHGYSRCALHLLLMAAETKVQEQPQKCFRRLEVLSDGDEGGVVNPVCV